MSAFHLATWTIQVFSRETEPAEARSAYPWGDSDKRVLANLPAMMESLEEDLTSLLPEGYRAIAKEWNEENWRSGLWQQKQ